MNVKDMLNDIQSKINDMRSQIDLFVNQTKDLKKSLCELELYENDLLHFSELYKLNAPKSVMAWKELEAVREERRQIKLSICLIEENEGRLRLVLNALELAGTEIEPIKKNNSYRMRSQKGLDFLDKLDLDISDSKIHINTTSVQSKTMMKSVEDKVIEVKQKEAPVKIVEKKQPTDDKSLIIKGEDPTRNFYLVYNAMNQMFQLFDKSHRTIMQDKKMKKVVNHIVMQGMRVKTTMPDSRFEQVQLMLNKLNK